MGDGELFDRGTGVPRGTAGSVGCVPPRDVTPLLEVRDAGKVFTTGGFLRKKHHVALEHVSFAISADRPSITAIAGESGSGKTTLARLILGILRPSSGEILYNGKSVGSMDRGE